MPQAFRQQTRQQQQQGLAPALIKSIQLLSMPYLSLQRFLRNYTLDNPFIELNEVETPCGDLCRPDDLLDYEEDRKGPVISGTDTDPVPLFRSPDPVGSLQEYLRLQLISSCTDRELLSAGEYLIRCIDDRGYLGEPPEQSRFSPQLLDRAGDLIRTFQPAGVGARTPEECLLLQADPKLCPPELIRAIFSVTPKDFSQRTVQKLGKICGTTAAAVQNGLRHLKALDPYPGRAFASSKGAAQYIYPEIEIITRGQELSFRLRSGSDLITINSGLYRETLCSGCIDAQTKKYISTRFREANELLNELSLCRNTEERLLNYVLKVQHDYFLHPDGALKPITMNQAAAALGLHPSTVSRCVSGRYIQSARGVMPYKALFSVSIPSEDGQGCSAAEVKRKISGMIASEGKKHPLSDGAIAEQLKEQGVSVSRRTVAKYREQLEIPESRARMRKEMFG